MDKKIIIGLTSRLLVFAGIALIFSASLHMDLDTLKSSAIVAAALFSIYAFGEMIKILASHIYRPGDRFNDFCIVAGSCCIFYFAYPGLIAGLADIEASSRTLMGTTYFPYVFVVALGVFLFMKYFKVEPKWGKH